jgi:hypothetical protein
MKISHDKPLHSKHTLGWCCNSFSVVCCTCGTYVCTGLGRCPDCASAIEDDDKVHRDIPIIFECVKATYKDIDNTLEWKLKTLPECAGAEDPEWIKREIQSAYELAEWSHGVLGRLLTK